MKKNVLLILLFPICLAIAQQDQQYTQYFVNGYVVNPAKAGSEDFIDARVSYRNQWTNFQVSGADKNTSPVSPRTVYVSVHSNIKHHGTGNNYQSATSPRHGVGGYVYDDKTGPISRSGIYGAYAYHLPIFNRAHLSFGTFVGLKQIRINGNDWSPHDNVILDDNLVGGELTKTVADASFGSFLYSNYYYVGLSVFQLFRNSVQIKGIGNENDPSDGKLHQHLIGTAGLKLPLSANVKLVPGIAVKMVQPAPISIDLNAIAYFNDFCFTGLSTRLGSKNYDAIAAVAGITLAKQLDISYSYDVTLSSINNFQSGSHEIIIGYRFKHHYHIDCPGRKFH